MASMKPLLRPQHLRGVFSAATTTTTPLFKPQVHHHHHHLPLPLPLLLLQSSIPSAARAASTTTTTTTRTKVQRPPEIPPPTPLVPDVATFLTVIGRGLRQHAAKIPDWESLFTLTSEQLRELGVEPPRSRKYLIRWRQRFRLGQYGVGGDLRHVEGGVAELRVLEAPPGPDPTQIPARYVVNVPPGSPDDVEKCDPAELSRVLGYHVKGVRNIAGPYALPLPGGKGARITVTEGMWEDRLGVKLDGGERRRTMVRYKKRIAERREARERGEL